MFCEDVLTLFHRDLGGVGHPPLVILHGMLGSSRNWQTTGRDLAARYHVFALDLRNHGSSPHAAEMSYAVMVDDVCAWLDAHHLSQVTLMGHSMGGKVAMRLACRHPERVRRLIVVDIAPRDYHSTAHRTEFSAMAELDVTHLASRAAAEQAMEAKISDWAMRKFLATNLERTGDGHWRWQVNLPVLAANLPALEGDSLSAKDRFVGETLWISGGKSRYVREADHAAIVHRFPKTRFETLMTAGHNPHMDAREAFVALIFSALS